VPWYWGVICFIRRISECGLTPQRPRASTETHRPATHTHIDRHQHTHHLIHSREDSTTPEPVLSWLLRQLHSLFNSLEHKNTQSFHFFHLLCCFLPCYAYFSISHIMLVRVHLVFCLLFLTPSCLDRHYLYTKRWKLTFLLSKYSLNWLKVTLKTSKILQKISILNKCFFFELPIHQKRLRFPKKYFGIFFNIDNNEKYFLSTRSAHYDFSFVITVI